MSWGCISAKTKDKTFDFSGAFSDIFGSDIFDDFFDGFGGGRRSGRRRQSENRGADLRYDSTISLEDAYLGKKQEIKTDALRIGKSNETKH